MKENNIFKTYASGLPGFGTIGSKGPAGENGLSMFFTDYDGLDAADEFILKNKIIENKSLLRTKSTEYIDGYEFGRRYMPGDYIIDKNSNVYSITNDSYVYKWLGFNYAVPNIFYTNNEKNTFNFKKYFNLYYGDDKFLVDNIYTDKIFNKDIYVKKIYDNNVRDFATLNYVNINNNVQPIAVFSTNSNDVNSAFAITKSTEKDKTSSSNVIPQFNIGNKNDNKLRNTQLSLDFSNVYLPKNTYIGDNLALSTGEFDLGVFSDKNFIPNPDTFSISLKQASNNKYTYKITWNLNDFFYEKMSNIQEMIYANLKLRKNVNYTTSLQPLEPNKDNLELYNIPSKHDGLEVTLENNNEASWTLSLEIIDKKTGWSRFSQEKTVSMRSSDINIHIINSLEYDVTVMSKIAYSYTTQDGNKVSTVISNNIPSVYLQKCSNTSRGVSPLNLSDIFINTTDIQNNYNIDFNFVITSNDGKIRNVTKSILFSEYKTLILRADNPKNYVTLDISPEYTSNENTEVYFETKAEADIQSSKFNKEADYSFYNRNISLNALNKTNSFIECGQFYYAPFINNVPTDISAYKLLGSSGVTLDAMELKSNVCELSHNFVKYPNLAIIPKSLATTMFLSSTQVQSSRATHSSNQRMNINPITYVFDFTVSNTKIITLFNESVKKGVFNFSYDSGFGWTHNHTPSRGDMAGKELLVSELILTFDESSSSKYSLVYDIPFKEKVDYSAKNNINSNCTGINIDLTKPDKNGKYYKFQKTDNNNILGLLSKIEIKLSAKYHTPHNHGTYPLSINVVFDLISGADITITNTYKDFIESASEFLIINERKLAKKDDKLLAYMVIESNLYNNNIDLSNTNKIISSTGIDAYTSNNKIYQPLLSGNPEVKGNIVLGYNASVINNTISNGYWKNVPFTDTRMLSVIYNSINVDNKYNPYSIPRVMAGYSNEYKYSLSRSTFKNLPGRLTYTINMLKVPTKISNGIIEYDSSKSLKAKAEKMLKDLGKDKEFKVNTANEYLNYEFY